MPTTLDTLVTYFVSDEDALLRGAKKSAQAVTRFSVSARKSLNTVGKSFIRVGKIAAIAVTAAAASVSVASIKLASDAEETQQKFSVVFSSIASDAEDMAKDLQKNYGLARTESKDLLSSTADLLTGFGFSQEAALDLSGEVQRLAVDLASFSNFAGGSKGASEALTKALLGERESVKALGISISEKAVKEEIARLATEGVTFATIEQAKAQAALTIAIRQSQNAIGDFARSQGSFANQTRILRGNITNIAEDIGKFLLPTVTKWTRVLNNAFILVTEGSAAAEKASDSFANSYVEGGNTIAKAAEELVAKIATPFIFLQKHILETKRGFLEFKQILGRGGEIITFGFKGAEEFNKRMEKISGFSNEMADNFIENRKNINEEILAMADDLKRLQDALDDPVGAARNWFKTIEDGTAATAALAAETQKAADIIAASGPVAAESIGAQMTSLRVAAEQEAQKAADALSEAAAKSAEIATVAAAKAAAAAQAKIDALPPLDFTSLLGTGFLGTQGTEGAMQGLGDISAPPPGFGAPAEGQLTIGGVGGFMEGEMGQGETPEIGDRGFGTQGIAALMGSSEFQQAVEDNAAAFEDADERFSVAAESIARSVGSAFAGVLSGQQSFGKAFIALTGQIISMMLNTWAEGLIAKVAMDQVEVASNSAAAAPDPFLIPAYVAMGLAAFVAAISSSGGSQYQSGGGGGGGGSASLSASSLSQATERAPRSRMLLELESERQIQNLNITLTDEKGTALMSWITEQTRNGIGDNFDRLTLASEVSG